MYNAFTALRLEKRELEEKRKDAERDRDVWKNRLGEQQRDDKRHRDICKHQLEEQQKRNEIDRDFWKQQLGEQQQSNERDRGVWKKGMESVREEWQYRLQEAEDEIKRLQVKTSAPQIVSGTPMPATGRAAPSLRLEDPEVIDAFEDIRQQIHALVNSPLMRLEGAQTKI